MELAIIQVAETNGHSRLVKVVEIRDVLYGPSGAVIVMRSGERAEVTDSLATVKAAIDTKWSEWLNAEAGLAGSGVSGTYTPTLTGVANVAASTAYECQYMRVGNTVGVSGKLDVDPTLATTSTQLGISLPIASDFGAAEDCGGIGAGSTVISESAAIVADATNNRAEMVWITTSLANHAMSFEFQYQVI